MDFRTQIPVFLPGNDRLYEEIAGVMTISEDGSDISVRLYSPQHALKLAEMIQNGQLLCLAFDYKKE